MLKERQIKILTDLETTNIYITAESLADKYNVSVRTIRNDIDEIDYVVKQYHGRFIRMPQKGMRIICDFSIAERLMSETNSNSFAALSKVQQQLIIYTIFLTNPNPISVNALADSLAVSTGTILNRLKEPSDILTQHAVALSGVKKKGFYIHGKSADFIRLTDTLLEQLSPDIFQCFFESGNAFSCTPEQELQRQKILSFIKDNLSLTPVNKYSINAALFFLVKNSPLAENTFLPETTSFLVDSTRKLLDHTQASGLSLNQPWALFAHHILLAYTNASDLLRAETGSAETRNIQNAIHCMIKKSFYYYPELEKDSSYLEQDLLAHVCTMINRMHASLDNQNPLLDEIKLRYPVIFATVKDLTKVFSEHYPLVLDEHQVSFFVLYFLQYLEKARARTSVHMLIVCNSGVGAARLLSTKIQNHFPEVSLIETDSSFNLESNKISLDNIDLIVSTIPLRFSGTIPVITVSPFLTNQELLSIRKALLKIDEPRQLHTTFVLPDDRPSAFSSLSASLPLAEQLDPVLYAELVADIFTLFLDLYPEGITADQYSIAVGILTHVIISMPRWLEGDFIKAYDYKDLKVTYPKEFSAILKFLNTTAEKLHIFIAPVEAAAILRYVIAPGL